MIAAALLSLAVAAVPGTPERQPGDTGEGGALLTWGNDLFGLPSGPDDHRTNQLALWVRGRGWNFNLDDSMLTACAGGRRTDEWTVSAGYDLAPGLTLGLGWRARGDYGGRSLQDLGHRVSGSRDLDGLSYDAGGGAPLVYAVYTVREVEGGVGYETVTSTLVAADGDLATDQAARGLVTWRWLTVWVGTRYQYRRTPAGAGEARAAVDAFENGLWVDAGLRLGWGAFETRYNPRDRTAVGSFTLYVGY